MAAMAAFLLIPYIANGETIDVNIKGVDDGVRTTTQRDYKEAVLFAKREAVERAGVKIKAMTTVKDLVVNSDYIESKAEAVLLPGYTVIDIGYQTDGSYLVVLIGKIKTGSPDKAAHPKAKVIEMDGSFVKLASEVVYDKNTELEWYAGPDKETNWSEAKKWVENLDDFNIAGGGWRMPTVKELQTLFQEGAGNSNMTPLLKTTGWFVWSGQAKDAMFAWGFYFHYGEEYAFSRSASYNLRGFAVRSKK